MHKMELLTPKSMTDEWLNRMKYGGCNPETTSKLRKSICVWYLFFNTTMVILMVLDSVFAEFESIGHFAEGLIITLGYFQEILKIAACLMKRQVLIDMLHILRNKFWPTSMTDKITEQRILKIYKILQITARVYGFNILFAASFFIIGAIITGEKSIPMDIWLPNKDILKVTPYFEIVSIIEIVFTLSSAYFCLIPYDALLFIFVGLVYAQFLMLDAKLMQIGEDGVDNYQIIKDCVNHHNLLLQFLEQIESVYSIALLLTIGSNLGLSTFTMYAVVMEDDPSRRVTFSMIFVGVFMQLFFYCQTGQFIQDEVEGIGQNAYECNWINIPDKKIRMSIKLIIMRCQKRFNITMGRFMVLNLETFTTVVRTSFSFLTFLENIKS